MSPFSLDLLWRKKYLSSAFRWDDLKMPMNTSLRAVLCVVYSAFLGFCTAQSCFAHGAAPKKIEENLQISAPPEKVWNIIKDFAGISSWDPKIKSSEAKQGEDQVKQRVLKLDTGGEVTDALTDYQADKMSYSYRRADSDVKALPASFYTATITVAPGKGGGSDVSWIGRYYRGDTSNEPPPELTDEAAAKALGDLFQSGLNNLKTLAEKK